ncbi:hypothetical protein OG432_34245 [Streptomyces sp. NBC_00442]|uniref:hypothetical protein n=1 Tax=Streptomyces sp. NBC_00442 TaxID=2903651 RepID=UPI002E1AFDD4
MAGFDHESAGALADGGADPARDLPDGTTPLLRAVDLGSPALVDALLVDDVPPHLCEDVQQRLLGLARRWCEAGAEDELRRRTGLTESAACRRVRDDPYSYIEELSLGGLTVRAGHSAILTTLERRFRIVTPVAELLERAVPHHHPDPVHRVFLADVAWSPGFGRTGIDATPRTTPNSSPPGPSTNRTPWCSPGSWRSTATTCIPVRRPSGCCTPPIPTPGCAARFRVCSRATHRTCTHGSSRRATP